MTASTAAVSQVRDIARQRWLIKVGLADYQLQPLPADASFRQYIRLSRGEQTYMMMDSPPDLEPCIPFVAIARSLRKQGVPVPEVIEADVDQGFLLLTDFGDTQYLTALSTDTSDHLYKTAMQQLWAIQACPGVAQYDLPVFDELALRYELNHFTHWYLVRYREFELSSTEQKLLKKTYDLLVESALAQTQVFCHRDYHSRNLMCLPGGHVGILDFQDALKGPVTYDLVSMLRDCYIDWPSADVERWARYYYDGLVARAVPVAPWPQFWQDFEWMGVHRHLKAVFIFARKYLRDHDSRYLEDIPRTLNYVAKVAKRYPALQDFSDWFSQRVLS